MANGMWEHGWPAHFYAMQRWKTLALEHAEGEVRKTNEGFTIGSVSAFDYAYAFFIWAHSMKDWLINTRAFEKKALEDRLRKLDEWNIVRDLANRVKHQKISRNPVDAEWIAGMKGSGNVNSPAWLEIEPYILHDKKYMKLEDCINAIWDMRVKILTKVSLLEVAEDGELKCID